MKSVRSAILYNQPEILDQLLKYAAAAPEDPERPYGMEWEITHTISTPCVDLDRQQCKNVISKHGLYDEECDDLPDAAKASSLLMLLYNFYDKLKDAIIEKLCKLLRDKFDYGQYFRSVVDIVANPKLVKAVLDLGADIHKIERTNFLRIVMTGTIYNP